MGIFSANFLQPHPVSLFDQRSLCLENEQFLVDRARHNDLQAFRQIVDRYKTTVYRIAYDMTGNRHDSEDICQEVFLKAYRSLGKFRGASKLSTWLYRITVNVCYDHRSRKSFTSMKTRDDLEQSAQEAPLFHGNASNHPEQTAEASVMQMHIERALTKLSPRERSIFVLRHYSDLQLKEIAETLGISEGAVKSILFRALKRLQKELAFYRSDLGLEKAS